MLIENLDVVCNRQPVLTNVSLDLDSPGIYGLLGANAIGKTTLFKAITGRLVFGGSIVSGPLKCAYIQCEPQELRRYYKQLILNKKRFLEEKLNEYATLFDIDFKQKSYDLNKENVSLMIIALTLSIESDCYILDEPLNDLNALNRKKVIQAIISLRQRDKIILISSHVLNNLEYLLEYLILFKQDQEVIQITVDELAYLHFNQIKEGAMGSIMYLSKRQYLHQDTRLHQSVSLKQCYEAIVEGVL